VAVFYKLPRGTKASLDAKVSGNTLIQYQAYWMTDQNRIAIATATNAYQMLPNAGEVVTLSGSQNITGAKSFTADPAIDKVNPKLDFKYSGSSIGDISSDASNLTVFSSGSLILNGSLGATVRYNGSIRMSAKVGSTTFSTSTKADVATIDDAGMILNGPSDTRLRLEDNGTYSGHLYGDAGSMYVYSPNNLIINGTVSVQLQYDGATVLTTTTSGLTVAGRLDLGASSTGSSTLRIPHGSAPTTPTNGDVWTTTAGMYVRINGVTVGPLGTGGGGSADGLGPDGNKGDITVGGTGTTLAINNGAVTYAKMQNISASQRLLGRITASAGVIEELTPANVRTIINVADGATANSTDATLLNRANHTGTQAATTLTVTATARFLGRVTAAAGAVEELTAAQMRTALNVADGATANSTDATLLNRANHTGTQAQSTITNLTTDLAAKGPALTPILTKNASYTAANAENEAHIVYSGAGTPVLTLNSTPSAGTSFTGRFTTAWSITCTSLSKNGAAPGANGSIAANSLITFLHEGSGTWVASGNGLT
jgi:hypothetical protein